MLERSSLKRLKAVVPVKSRAPLAAILTGLLLALTFVPYPWSFLAPLPLAGLFWQLETAPTRRTAFSRAFWAGVGFFALHLLWLPVSFAELFGPVILLPLLLLPFVLGAFWGVTACLSRLASRYTLLALPFAWVVMEYLRSLGTFSFTWGTLGYALLPTPVAQVADLGGVYLLSLLVALSAAALAAAFRGQRWPLAGMSAILLAAALYGVTRPAPPQADRTVLLVQGAVSPLEKAAGRNMDELELYTDLSRQGVARSAEPVDLVVWPEGASPLPAEDARVRASLAALGRPAIVGAPRYALGYQNTAYGFDDGVTGAYSKVKLVPFGESFPLRQPLAFLYDPLFDAIGLSGLVGAVPGESYTPLLVADVSAGTYICYESVFPQVARAMVRRGANLLVNISNDAWFGRTQGAEQHFQMGRLRAIETRRYVARAGNDGISAVIDPLGRVLERFPRGERAAFEARVGLSDALTPYVRYGDWVVPLSLVLSGSPVLVASVRRSRVKGNLPRA